MEKIDQNRTKTIGWKCDGFVMAFNSTVDMCKNCAKCGKGFKIGTNQAYNIKIKIRLGGISKIFCCLFSRQYGFLRQRHFTEEEILEKIFT